MQPRTSEIPFFLLGVGVILTYSVKRLSRHMSCHHKNRGDAADSESFEYSSPGLFLFWQDSMLTSFFGPTSVTNIIPDQSFSGW